MIPSAVLSRYARALADVALESGREAEVLRDLQTYQEICKAVPDLLPAFDNPAIPREVKDRLLSELLARYPVAPTTANFLRVLLGHHRLLFFQEICALYVRTVNARKGLIMAQVRAASSLSGADLAALRESLARVTGKTIQLEVRTDQDLLGGVIVQIGSTVYDGSIRTQLEEIKRALTAG
jgi:F-type H+-transporting ATPase subunit delta